MGSILRCPLRRCSRPCWGPCWGPVRARFGAPVCAPVCTPVCTRRQTTPRGACVTERRASLLGNGRNLAVQIARKFEPEGTEVPMRMRPTPQRRNAATPQRAGTSFGSHGLFIALPARSRGVTLVTNDTREFTRQPGLRVRGRRAAAALPSSGPRGTRAPRQRGAEGLSAPLAGANGEPASQRGRPVPGPAWPSWTAPAPPAVSRR